MEQNKATTASLDCLLEPLTSFCCRAEPRGELPRASVVLPSTKVKVLIAIKRGEKKRGGVQLRKRTRTLWVGDLNRDHTPHTVSARQKPTNSCQTQFSSMLVDDVSLALASPGVLTYLRLSFTQPPVSVAGLECQIVVLYYILGNFSIV